MLDVIRKLMELLDRRERRRFWLLCFMVLVMGFANMIGVAAIIPLLAVLGDPEKIHVNPWLSDAYDTFGFTSDHGFMVALGFGAFVIFMLTIAIRVVTTYALFRFGAMRNYSITAKILGGYLQQPYAWFLHRHSADLVKTVLTEIAQMTGGVIMPLLNMLSNAVVVLFLIALLVLVDPLASLLMATVMAGGYGVVFALVRRRLQQVGTQRYDANQARFRIAQEALSGVKEIKVLGLEASTMRRFHKPGLRFAEAIATDSVLGEIPRHILEGIAFGGMMAVLLLLLATNDDSLSAVLPVAGVYALAGARLTPAMQVVYRGFSQIKFSKAALDSVYADYMEARDIPRRGPLGAPLRLKKLLELRDIGYAYPKAEHPALRGLTLDIRANTTIGIVGGSGAGKTTAMDILLGLLSPAEGALVVDGHEVRDDDARRNWRRSLGYVPQQIFLADDTVAANIAFGQAPEDIDLAAVERAARMAQLHDFVMTEMPKGYASTVGDRGVRLSGGQRQRIGIARALYHDPDVLILDEATSALDNITERAVMESVAALGGAKTIIMVAHRLSTVRHCDEIFLLAGGTLTARGTYDALIESNEAFQNMARDVN
ncbi:MAG: ABC-type multidrug transport system fused ATPase/permease subunit [Paracoccaceae bacterium]|jgi:ABC-type multidrug transport system fused ATPase/permease subunit